jgi:hypothetical protein
MDFVFHRLCLISFQCLDYTLRGRKKQGFLPFFPRSPEKAEFYTLSCHIEKGNWYVPIFFGKCDENSLEKAGFVLAFCAIYRYNEHTTDYGGVCTWVS